MKKLLKFYLILINHCTCVNKVDNPEMRSEIYDFYSLGFGEPFPISGTHGLGFGDMLDEAANHFPKIEEEAMTMKTRSV